MRYGTAAAFRHALEQRLKDRAEEEARAVQVNRSTGASLPRLRKLVAFDRLLARLAAVAPDRWTLKGGLALDYRLRDRARTTVDVDLHRQDDEAAANADFRAAEQVDLGDYFVFVIERSPVLDTADVAGAVRYPARCELAGRRFEEFAVDVGFADPPVTAPDVLRGPDLLSFADLPPVVVPALPLAQHVAEKVHAHTRTYRTAEGSGRPSTRVKDLIDLVLIARHTSLGAQELRRALEETFAARATHALPPALPPPPEQWASRFRSYATELALPVGLAEGHRTAASLVDPVLADSLHGGARWDPASGAWE